MSDAKEKQEKKPEQQAEKATEKKAEAKAAPKKAAAKTKTTKKAPLKASERKCQIDNCKKAYRAKGYCRSHYKKWRQGEYGLARYKTCGKGECRQPMAMNRMGFCEEHYQNKYVKKIAAPAAEAAAPEAEATEEAAAESA